MRTFENFPAPVLLPERLKNEDRFFAPSASALKLMRISPRVRPVTVQCENSRLKDFTSSAWGTPHSPATFIRTFCEYSDDSSRILLNI